MPTAKDKGGIMSTRYRPASEYDDATLAQKREYWRTKKREQRARRAEFRLTSKQKRRRELLQRESTFKGKDSRFSVAAAASLSCTQEREESLTLPSAAHGLQNSCKAVQNQKKWICQPASVNTILPDLSPSRTTENNTAAVKVRTQQAANNAVTSPAPSESPLNTTFLVPPLNVTQISNGSCKPTTSESCVFMQDTSVPNMQYEEQDAPNTKKTSPVNVIAGVAPVFSSCDTSSVTTEGARTNATPLHETQSALATTLRAKSNGISKPPAESEEERAAKRRELWRIKKREQRARLAARIGNVRVRTQAADVEIQKTAAQKVELMGALLPQHLQLKAGIQRQCPSRVKATLASAKKENNKMQGVTGCLTTVNLQTKDQNPQGFRTAQTSDGIPVKILGESSRRFSSYVHLSNVSRGFVRCKTARQRFIDAQKNFMNLRNMRCKSPLLSSVFRTANIPKIDPNDTPEQIIAKRREYWRIKKREQRAKLTSEVKIRLKEKDSLMRRVKRYQSILEEMRRARGLAQSAGGALTQASEAIGGFIKEDGTLTNKIPQASIGHTASDEAPHEGSNDTFVTQVQHQVYTRRKGTKQYPPPSCTPQVKISLPGRSFNKLPKLHSVRAKALHGSTSHNSQSVPTRSACQLTLTHPKASKDVISVGSATGSDVGGCVRKMAVSSSTATPLSTNSPDPELSEEERMAKKREYWRIKKREQRAAHAVRLKQGVLQARVSAALQRRRAQKQAAVTTVPMSTRRTTHIASTQTQPVGNVPVLPNAHKIKQETESVPDADLNSCSEQAICPDIKSPTSPPAPQPECDPALTGDTQATTLLAVASMKKLLEESLSTVVDCNEVQTNVKTEEDAEDQEMKPNLPPLLLEKEEGVPLASDLMLHIKSWQPDTEDLVQAGSLSPQLKDSPQFSETWSPIPASSEEVPPPTCEHSSQTPSNVIIIPYVDTPDDTSSQRTSPGISPKQESCSTEPPQLHVLATDQLHPQLQSFEKQERHQLQIYKSPSTRSCSNVSDHRGLSSMQRKREYWKLMKRQQRARLKAQQKERKGDCSRRLSTANPVAPAVVVTNTAKGLNPKPALQHTPSISHSATDAHISAINDGHSEETLAEISCSFKSEKVNTEFGSSYIIPKCQRTSQDHQKASPSCQEWISTSTATLPTLKPPDNPLSRIKLQPIEPHGQTPQGTVLSPIKIPCPGRQSVRPPPTQPLSVNSLAPPKRIPGEPDEDFLRRKREYWRIKKKEQRARKAIHVKEVGVRRASNERRLASQAEELPTQDSVEWVSSPNESQHLLRASADTGVFPFSNYTAPVEDTEDEPVMLFADYETNSGEETSESYAMWRNHYLMDYDPLNQLLVCMVCGELQYTHSVEGARSHISDAHPETLTLDNGERQQILEAWDEQVSQRERFFTSQLQQNSGSLTGTHGT